MRYFWAVVFPPIAVLLCARPFAFLINCVLSLVYFPGMIHALFVVSAWERKRHLDELAALVGAGSRRK
jgi:uncharacterized membrane protein YqaE (UPF0057 family)